MRFLCKSKINFFEMDIRNSLIVSDFIKSKNIKTIIHCAGLKSVKNSELHPDEYEEVNVTGTHELLNSFINSNNKFSGQFLFGETSSKIKFLSRPLK